MIRLSGVIKLYETVASHTLIIATCFVSVGACGVDNKCSRVNVVVVDVVVVVVVWSSGCGWCCRGQTTTKVVAMAVWW